MTTADHRRDADQYSDQADDRRFDRDGGGHDADRAGEADASGAHPVDVDSDSSATTGRSTDRSVDNSTDQSFDHSVDRSVDSSVDRSADHPADHAAAAGDGTPAVSGTVAAVPTTTSSTSATTAPSGTASGTSTGSGGLERLVPANRVEEYTSRWDAVKGEFVDEPRQAVAKADKLVGELLDELDQLFRKQRSDLEHGLDADETSTEDLRLALRKYRSFFDRLLNL